MFPSPPLINKPAETIIDESKTRTIPIIHEYRSSKIPLNTIESRTTHQSRMYY